MNSINVENRDGLDAILYSLNKTKAFKKKDARNLLRIQFKVNQEGIALTDPKIKQFKLFPMYKIVLRHFMPANTILSSPKVNNKLYWPSQITDIKKPKYINFFNLKIYLNRKISREI